MKKNDSLPLTKAQIALAEIARKKEVLANRERLIRQKLSQQERKDRTRRLIIYGNWLDFYKRENKEFGRIVDASLDKQLDKAVDRKLFGLPELPAKPAS